jgi:hypothetical protein
MQQTKAQRRLVLAFGADKSGANRGGQAHRKHGKAGTVDSEQLWVTGAGSLSGTARALGKRGKQERSHVTQEQAGAELEMQVRRREQRGKVSGKA